nr:lipopolysaccharide biosynthesis protein [uncultured Desulfobulbus sp.]
MYLNTILKNASLSALAKIINALIQVISLPVLLGTFGKDNYGLIVIAMSLNTFIAIFQLGLPTGVPKFVAEWLAKKEYCQLRVGAKTILCIYLGISLFNFFVIFLVALFGESFFKVHQNQVTVLKDLLLITSFTSFFAIPAAMLDQCLIGAQKLGFVAKTEIVVSFFFANLVIIVHFCPLLMTIVQFYAIRCAIIFLMVPWKILQWIKIAGIGVIIPSFNFDSLRPLLKYCFAVSAFAIFTAIAERSRPIILGVRIPHNVAGVLADYQIVNYVKMFLEMISSTIVLSLIPYISGTYAEGDKFIYKNIITVGTKFIWAFGAMIGFSVILLSREILLLYVGGEYLYLNKWLVLLVIGFLYNLYNPGMSSAILSSNCLRPLIYATFVGCIGSSLICWFFAPYFGIGALIYSFIFYNFILFCFTHFWYFPRFFHIDPFQQILKILLPPIFAGLVMCFVGRICMENFGSSSIFINIMIGESTGLIVYLSIIVMFYIKPADLKGFYRKLF